LEDAIGVALFNRTSKGVQATIAGERVLKRGRAILDDVEALKRTATLNGRGEEGGLRFGIVASIAAGFSRQLLDTFSNAHPGIELAIIEGSPKANAAAVRMLTIDFAFVTGMPLFPACEIEGAGAAVGTGLAAGGMVAAGAGLAAGGVGALGAAGGAAAGAARGSASIAGAATTAYRTAAAGETGAASVAAGMGGVAGAGGSAAVQAAASPLRRAAASMGESYRSGARSAFTATGGKIRGEAAETNAGAPADAGAGGEPAWARAARRRQATHQGVSTAAHVVRSGDHGGSGSSINLSEGE